MAASREQRGRRSVRTAVLLLLLLLLIVIVVVAAAAAVIITMVIMIGTLCLGDDDHDALQPRLERLLHEQQDRGLEDAV